MIAAATCAIDKDGVAWCWGGNNTGALGILLS
jgi:alpha-tubulin suppressor-like RCC1 family protein